MGEALTGKVAVITGAGRGIGRAIAFLMADEGAKVVVNDLGASLSGQERSSEPADGVVREIALNGGSAAANYDTVATMDGGRNIIQTALDEFGRVDILVNNAGVFSTSPFVEITEEQWDTMLQVHLKGHFCCTKAAVPHMIKQRSGRILNVSSGAALGVSGIAAAHYGAAKAGILGLTRNLALELREYGITVNAIMPSARTRLDQLSPLGTREKQAPEDVAPLVGYLASDQAAHISGLTFVSQASGVVHLMSDLKPSRGFYSARRWTVAELIVAMAKLRGVN